MLEPTGFTIGRRKEVIKAIQEHLSTAKKRGIFVDYNEFSAKLGLEHGLSERKINEYFKQLERVKLLEVYELDGKKLVGAR